MKHRCLSGFLALVMLVCTLYSDVCIADEIEDNITLLQDTSTTLTADNIEISGDTANINFAVSDNPGICFLDVKIEYDKTVFSLNEETGCTAGDLFSSGSIEVKENASGSEIIWYSVKDIDKDGVVFSLTFDVREGTAAGSYPIGVKLVQKNTINSKEEMVPVNCVSGSITIRNFSPLFIAEQTEIKCTGEFEYGISIQDNPGIAGFGVLISYDTNYLTLICENDDNPKIERAEAFNNGIMIATATESGVRVLWSANSNNNSEGQIFSLRFEPKVGAIGPSNISISVENENTLNENETEISFEAKSGKVVVKHDILLIPAKTPNCIEPGNISYWKCKDCEACFSDEECISKINESDTIRSIDLKVHKTELKHIEAKKENCVDAGNIEYWTCESCGKLYIDSKADKEVLLQDVLIPADVSKHKMIYISNGDGTHDYVCEQGDVETVRSDCEFDVSSNEDGSYFEACALCGYSIDHDWGDVDPEDAYKAGFDIDSIPEGIWLVGISDVDYQGKAVTFDLRVYSEKTLLKQGKDYKVTYKNNKKAHNASGSSAPTIVIEAIGNYEGKITRKFAINPLDISGNEAFTSADVLTTYNKSVQKIKPKLLYNGKTLTLDTDYTVSFPDKTIGAYKLPGTYDVVITGKGNYKGSITVKETIIEQVLISKATATKIPSFQYCGYELVPEFDLVYKNRILNGIDANEFEQLSEEIQREYDYTYSVSNNVEVGTASIYIVGRNKFAGERKLSFKITGISMSKITVSGIVGKTYTGQSIEQNGYTVKYVTGSGSKKKTTYLTEGEDYTVSYKNNIKAGTATISFQGIGLYYGTLKKTYKISAYNVKYDVDSRISVEYEDEVAYGKKGAYNNVSVFYTYEGIKTQLVSGTDYKLSFANNDKVCLSLSGTSKKPTVVITGKGNFSGERKKEYFIINKRDISEVTFTAIDVAATSEKGVKSTLTVIDNQSKGVNSSGKQVYNTNKLVKDTDYSLGGYYYAEDTTVKKYKLKGEYPVTAGNKVASNDIVQPGTKMYVTIVGKGKYEGEARAYFTVTKKVIDKVSFAFSSKVYYTGKPIEVDTSMITATVTVGKNKQKLIAGQDYRIVNVENNVSARTVTVTFEGINDYGGTKTVTLKLARKLFRLFEM